MRKKRIVSSVGVILLAGALAAGVCCMGYAARGDDGKWFGNGDIKTWHWKDNEQTEQLPAEGGENATAHTCVKAMAATYSVENNISTLSADSATQSVTIDNVVKLKIGDRVYANSFILIPFSNGSDCVPQEGFCDCGHYIAIKDESGVAWTFYVDFGYDTSRFRVFKGGNLQSSVEVDPDSISTSYGNCFPLSSYVDIPNGVIDDGDLLTYYSAVVQLPADPVKEGYTFVGWYYDSALTRPYNGEPISVDTQFYAKFEINTFTVTFNSDGGSEVASQTVNWNTAATLTTPTREKYAFKGWFLPNGTQYANQPIKEDTTLTAHWERNVFNVTFNTSGGSAVDPVEVNLNSAVTLPTTTKKGYIFKGWYLSDGTQYTNQPVTGDITLTAHWEVQTFTVTFYVDGEIYATATVEYGQSLIVAMEEANVAAYRAMSTDGLRISKQSFAVEEDTQVLLSELTGWEKYGDFVARNQWYTWLMVGIAGVLVSLSVVGVVEMLKKRK